LIQVVLSLSFSLARSELSVAVQVLHAFLYSG
jgi:hypothetical protein